MSDKPVEQRGESDSRRLPPLARVGRWMQGLVEGSAILATAGYLSLRSHFNYLGVSSNGSIGVEPYLRECAYMAYTLVERIALPAVLLAGGWALLGAAGWVLSRRASWGRALAALRSRGSGLLSHGVTGRLLLIYLVVLYLYAIADSLVLALDAVAIGPLNSEQLGEVDAKSFDIVYLSCLVALWLCYRATRRPAASFAWSLAWAVSLLLCIYLPQLFGRTIHERSYQEIRVDSRSGTGATCGLLVLNAQGSLLLWRVREGKGEILSVPAAQGALTVQGRPRDLLAMAREGASNPGLTLPLCEQ